jgi:hypothetical protein
MNISVTSQVSKSTFREEIKIISANSKRDKLDFVQNKKPTTPQGQVQLQG